MGQKNKSNNHIEWCIHQGILANQGIHWCEKQLKDYPDCCGKHCPYYEEASSFFSCKSSFSPEGPKERRIELEETKSYNK